MANLSHGISQMAVDTNGRTHQQQIAMAHLTSRIGLMDIDEPDAVDFLHALERVFDKIKVHADHIQKIVTQEVSCVGGAYIIKGAGSQLMNYIMEIRCIVIILRFQLQIYMENMKNADIIIKYILDACSMLYHERHMPYTEIIDPDVWSFERLRFLEEQKQHLHLVFCSLDMSFQLACQQFDIDENFTNKWLNVMMFVHHHHNLGSKGQQHPVATILIQANHILQA